MLVRIIILFLLYSLPSLAIFDWMGAEARRAVEIAAYADAAAGLVNEVSPNEEIKAGAQNINARAQRLRSEASRVNYVSNTTKSLLAGPDWSSKRLDSNIRSTTEYVRRLKRLIAQVAVLGTDGTIMLNGTETNMQLSEMQKNQQAMLLQAEDQRLASLEREHEEAKSWDEFASRQRKVRSKGVASGKP